MLLPPLGSVDAEGAGSAHQENVMVEITRVENDRQVDGPDPEPPSEGLVVCGEVDDEDTDGGAGVEIDAPD